MGKRVPSVLTAKEVELLLSQPKDVDLKGIRDKAMLEFAYATGMKVTEIVMLNIEDVDLEAGYVKCKTGKERSVPQTSEDYFCFAHFRFRNGFYHYGIS
mgnify:CR=1 FL=1